MLPSRAEVGVDMFAVGQRRIGGLRSVGMSAFVHHALVDLGIPDCLACGAIQGQHAKLKWILRRRRSHSSSTAATARSARSITWRSIRLKTFKILDRRL